ncbi:hypothetical protein ABZU76_17040 [Amycolatopsis sp. NPDC005232]|uniref:hypothetical protein n=1 Tax=Amycolatopsis sp. NPDC005232 TaxID=3157027 RepID=UPI0033B92DAA
MTAAAARWRADRLGTACRHRRGRRWRPPTKRPRRLADVESTSLRERLPGPAGRR